MTAARPGSRLPRRVRSATVAATSARITFASSLPSSRCAGHSRPFGWRIGLREDARADARTRSGQRTPPLGFKVHCNSRHLNRRFHFEYSLLHETRHRHHADSQRPAASTAPAGRRFRDACVVVRDGRIAYAGPRRGAAELPPNAAAHRRPRRHDHARPGRGSLPPDVLQRRRAGRPRHQVSGRVRHAAGRRATPSWRSSAATRRPAAAAACSTSTSG